MADITNLSQFLTDVAESIRIKRETTEQIPAANFDTEIMKITTGVMTQEEYDRCDAKANDILGTPTYTLLEYIASTGTQLIDTEYVPNHNTKVEFEIEGGTTDMGVVFGDTVSQNHFLLYYFHDGSLRYFYGNEYVIPFTGERTKFIIYRRYIQKNDTILNNNTAEVSAMQFTSNLTLFGISGITTNKNSYKLYSFKIYENDVLIKNFVPVKDNYGVICLYDTVNDKYHYNTGTGVFNAGGEI